MKSERGNESQSRVSPGFHLRPLIFISFHPSLPLPSSFTVFHPWCSAGIHMSDGPAPSDPVKQILAQSDLQLSCLFLLCLARRPSVLQLPSRKHSVFVWPSKNPNTVAQSDWTLQAEGGNVIIYWCFFSWFIITDYWIESGRLKVRLKCWYLYFQSLVLTSLQTHRVVFRPERLQDVTMSKIWTRFIGVVWLSWSSWTGLRVDVFWVL